MEKKIEVLKNKREVIRMNETTYNLTKLKKHKNKLENLKKEEATENLTGYMKLEIISNLKMVSRKKNIEKKFKR